MKFLFGFEKMIKNHELWIFFAKTLRTSLKKFLDNQTKLFANTTQTFFDKRGFQKLEKKSKNIHMYSDKLTNQFWLKKNLRYRFYF